MSRKQIARALPWIAGAIFVLAACSATPSSTGSSTTPTATARRSASPTPPTPSESPLDVIDFDVSGTIGGHAVRGKLARASFAVPCAAAGSDQVISVHWIGEAPADTPLQGEVDFKAGTWTLGGTSAQGTATVGLQGGKAMDALIPASGTVTTSATGGTIDATFTGGADSLHVAGSWTCPPAS